MLYAIKDSLSNPACSDIEEDADDKEVDEEDIVFGKLSSDTEPSWVMGTISKTIQNCKK
jgi:hypothetical protein